MSTVDRDTTTVSNDGITVNKTPDTEQFETLAIVFDIRSEREDTVWVRISDELPTDIDIEDVGFHPDYGAEFWDVEENTIVFEREFDPVEEFTTVYGVREYPADDNILFSDDPTIDIIDDDTAEKESTQIEDVASPEDSEAVREVIAGERDSLPGMGSPDDEPLVPEEPREAEASAETPDFDPFAGETDDLDEETVAPPEDTDSELAPVSDIEEAAREALAEDTTQPEQATEPTDATEESDDESTARDEITVPVTGGVARVLAKELREGNIDPEDKRVLKQELLSGSGSTDARIKHLQSELSDLAAYTDALEVFLDENGEGQEILNNLESRTDAIESSLQTLEAQVESTTETIKSVENSIETFEADIDSIAGDVKELESLDGQVDSLEAKVTEVESKLEEMAAFRDRLASAFGENMGE